MIEKIAIKINIPSRKGLRSINNLISSKIVKFYLDSYVLYFYAPLWSHKDCNNKIFEKKTKRKSSILIKNQVDPRKNEIIRLLGTLCCSDASSEFNFNFNCDLIGFLLVPIILNP